MYCQLYFSKYFENNLISSNARKYWSVINLNIELGLFVIIVVAYVKLVHCKGKKINLIKTSHRKISAKLTFLYRENFQKIFPGFMIVLLSYVTNEFVTPLLDIIKYKFRQLQDGTKLCFHVRFFFFVFF